MEKKPLVPGKPKPFVKELPPAGTHRGVCHSVHDLGFQTTTWQGKTKTVHQVVLVWEIDKALTKGDFAGQPFVVSKKYTFSFYERSQLRHDIASWRGRDFTESELEKFDLNCLAGQQCLITIIHTNKNGNTYANISSVTAVPTGVPALAQTLPPEHEFKWISDLQAKAVTPPEEESEPDAEVGGVNF